MITLLEIIGCIMGAQILFWIVALILHDVYIAIFGKDKNK